MNDASGVTMLSVRSCSRGGDDFWCASRTTTVCYMFLPPQSFLITFKWREHGAVFPVSANVKPGVDPELSSDYRTLKRKKKLTHRSHLNIYSLYSLHSRVKFTTLHEFASWEGLLPGSSSLVAKCIPVFVKVRRCIY